MEAQLQPNCCQLSRKWDDSFLIPIVSHSGAKEQLQNHGWVTTDTSNKTGEVLCGTSGNVERLLEQSGRTSISAFEHDATVSEDEVRFALFEASSMQAAAEHMAGSEKYFDLVQSNHQRLVLGSFGHCSTSQT